MLARLRQCQLYGQSIVYKPRQTTNIKCKYHLFLPFLFWLFHALLSLSPLPSPIALPTSWATSPITSLRDPSSTKCRRRNRAGSQRQQQTPAELVQLQRALLWLNAFQNSHSRPPSVHTPLYNRQYLPSLLTDFNLCSRYYFSLIGGAAQKHVKPSPRVSKAT